MVKKTKTNYGVYIIESLRSNDFVDGENLSAILELCKIDSIYNWADTIADFKRLIMDFKTSQFRYLHISCHASNTGITINGEELSNVDLQGILHEGLENKRVFMSACKGGNRDIASRIISICKVLSLIGTPIDLPFEKSVLFWPSFYHLMNEIDQNKMKRSDIKENLKKCVDLFGVPINYFSRINNSSMEIRRLKIRPNKPMDNRKLMVKFNII